MSASKSRPRWADLPGGVRADIETLIGGAVVEAANCPGGYSPGFASRLTMASGRAVFVKAVDSVAWPPAVATFANGPATAALPRDHPRLGGWAAVARDPALVAALPATSRWAADHLTSLIRWEADRRMPLQPDCVTGDRTANHCSAP